MSKGQREMTYEELKYAYMILADYGIEVIEWITEQAERVQELEEENKRYREALSIISANLPLDGREHYVDIARKTLEGEE